MSTPLSVFGRPTKLSIVSLYLHLLSGWAELKTEVGGVYTKTGWNETKVVHLRQKLIWIDQQELLLTEQP